MSESTDLFDELKTTAEVRGVPDALRFLADHFRREKKHHQLFEVLKMQTRHRIGLPLLHESQPDEIDEPGRRQLEDGLLSACREVGTLLVRDGNLQDGWVYLQPVGDPELNRELIRNMPLDDENTDAVVEVALSQAADPEYGYSIVLQKYGTCNAITTMDTHAMHFDKQTRGRMAGMLVEHIHDELTSNVRLHIEREKGLDAASEISKEAGLSEMLQLHPWLTNNGSHHIDATHLASVMRISTVVEDAGECRRLVELAEYGDQLADEFQFPGNPPFEDGYCDYRMFYRALYCHKTQARQADSEEAGLENVEDKEAIEKGIQHLDRKLRSAESKDEQVVAETLIDLLYRTGSRQRALDVAMDRLAGEGGSQGIAPLMFEIADSNKELESVMHFFREREDLLGYSIGLLKNLR